MSHRERVILEISTVLIIIGGVYACFEIRHNHDLLQAAQATTDQERAQRKADKAEAQKIADTQQQAISELRDKLEKIKTPQQAAAAIPSIFPGVQPPTIIQVPGQPGTTQYMMSADQMMKLAQQGEACQECKVNLAAVEGQKKLEDRDLEGCKKEVGQWQDAAKGGSLWHRFTHDLRLTGTAILTGAVIGAVLVKTISPWRHQNGIPERHRVGADHRPAHSPVFLPGPQQAESETSPGS
jgi:hypothetical protein